MEIRPHVEQHEISTFETWNNFMSNFTLTYTWISYGKQIAGAKGSWKIYRKNSILKIFYPFTFFPVNLEKITVIHFQQNTSSSAYAIPVLNRSNVNISLTLKIVYIEWYISYDGNAIAKIQQYRIHVKLLLVSHHVWFK